MNQTDEYEDLPLVSVVAVCYNHARFVVETLDSIIAQTYPNVQLIIMDDCSQDNSVEVIEAWIERNSVECLFIPHKENRGLCRTLNEALGLCQGKYVQFISCDDVLFQDKIDKQTDLIRTVNLNDVIFVYSDMQTINENGEVIAATWFPKSKLTSVPEGFIYQELIKRQIIPSPTLLIEAEKLRTLGGFNENLVFEDLDFILKAAKHFRILYLNEVTVKYRILQNSLSRSLNSKYIINHLVVFSYHLRHAKGLSKLALKMKISKYAKKAYLLNSDAALKWLAYSLFIRPTWKNMLYFIKGVFKKLIKIKRCH